MKKRRWWLLALGSLIATIPLCFCCGLPLLTGQACIDPFSSHVPPRAIERFLTRIFDAVRQGDEAWLAANIADQGALDDLMRIQPQLSAEFEIDPIDSMVEMYEYRIRFDNGVTVLVIVFGDWPQCPDFRVTESEIFEHLRLESVHLESP
jgi:hypothetical protein